MSKWAYGLYRVSTKGQVEKDDIPMQKQRCHEFAAAMGWDIVKEFSEKGVSGFKVSAKDRDAILEIQKDAALGKFDVLLVYMFDKIGRKEDETPFIVEWFVKNGVEVWSAEEGQQKIENHTDKLMNYIRYWQASGESIKTSIRVKTRLGQIVQEGRFRGGAAPYGYRLVKNGRLGKKNRELYDVEIDPEEAPTIQRIFDLAEQYGYGGRKIASELKENGTINARTGEAFHYSSIQNILRNIMYVGILRSGETVSEVFPNLQIISPKQFERVSSVRGQRSNEYLKQCQLAYEQAALLEDGSEGAATRQPQTAPRKNVGNALLSGNVYCGHCGGRIFASTARKNHHPTVGGTVERIPVYKCYNRTQHKDICDGATTYRAQKVDEVISELLTGILEKARRVNERDLIDRQVAFAAKAAEKQLKQAKAELTKSGKELSRWSDLMMDSIEGRCVFTPEQVKERMDVVQASIDESRKKIQALQAELSATAIAAGEIHEQHQRLLSWAEIFDTADPAERKMIASYMIKAVSISRDYQLQVEFNISQAQYLGGMEMG